MSLSFVEKLVIVSVRNFWLSTEEKNIIYFDQVMIEK